MTDKRLYFSSRVSFSLGKIHQTMQKFFIGTNTLAYFAEELMYKDKFLHYNGLLPWSDRSDLAENYF
jgi:hypothetical protein